MLLYAYYKSSSLKTSGTEQAKAEKRRAEEGVVTPLTNGGLYEKLTLLFAGSASVLCLLL